MQFFHYGITRFKAEFLDAARDVVILKIHDIYVLREDRTTAIRFDLLRKLLSTKPTARALRDRDQHCSIAEVRWKVLTRSEACVL